MNLQKFGGNEMRPVKGSTGILLFPMSNNAFEKTSADMSFCNATRMFVVNLRFFTYLYKIDAFEQAFISSAAVDLGMTGNVWRKSPTSRIIVPPKRI